MNFEGNFRYQGQIDVSQLATAILEEPEEIWSEAVARVAKVHRQSRGIFLKNNLKPEHFYGTIFPDYPRLVSYLQPVLEQLRRKLGPCYLVRLQFSRHLGGDGFDPHHDKFSFTLVNSYRLHIPIVTNESVWFSVGDERKHLALGEIWEINNVRVHAGRNEGNSPRIHLIVDFARPLHSLEERARYFMNLEQVAIGSGWPLCRPKLEGETFCESIPMRWGTPPEAEGRVSKDVAVSFNYKIRDAHTGRLILADFSNEPPTFVPGYGQLPPAMESALQGLKIGQAFDFELEGEKAYGIHNPQAEYLVSNDEAPDVALQVGAHHIYHTDDGPILATVTRKESNGWRLDQNHLFARRRIRVEGKVQKVRSLEVDEYRYGIYEGPTLSMGKTPLTIS